MTKLQQDESGFSAIEGLLIVVAVAIVLFAGYFVYSAQKNASATLKTANSTAAKDKLSYKPKAPANSTSRPVRGESDITNGYMVIREWGMEFPLPSAISDAYYVQDPSDSSYQNIDLGTRSLTAMDPACAANLTGPGALARETIAVHDKNVASPGLDDPVYSTKIGNYY